ncbi:MAG: hypothetical protein ACRDRA_00990 [Pseudonocardiaceae bacterium]
MDSLTHLYLADALISMSSGNNEATACALLPQIDRAPAYYHRLFAHPFSQGSRIIGLAESILWPQQDGTVDNTRSYSNLDGSTRYLAERLRADRNRIHGYMQKYNEVSGRGLRWRASKDQKAMALAFTSHAYQDMFNNPIQAFLPYSPFPSGRWELFERTGGLDFRSVLYQRQNIEELRYQLFGRNEWNIAYPTSVLIEAVVRRTAASCTSRISEEIIGKACADLGIQVGIHDSHVITEAMEFLDWHERFLDELIYKFSRSIRSSGDPEWIGDGRISRTEN